MTEHKSPNQENNQQGEKSKKHKIESPLYTPINTYKAEDEQKKNKKSWLDKAMEEANKKYNQAEPKQESHDEQEPQEQQPKEKPKLTKTISPYGNGKLSKRALLFTTGVISLVILIVFLSIFLVQNKSLSDAEKSRDTRLAIYESSKLWVVEDIRSYLQVKDEASYKTAREDSHMTSELKSGLYGSEFNYANFAQAKKVSFADAQYSLAKTDDNSSYLEKGNSNSTEFKIYLLANVTMQDGTVKALNLIVSLKNNQIYDVLMY